MKRKTYENKLMQDPPGAAGAGSPVGLPQVQPSPTVQAPNATGAAGVAPAGAVTTEDNSRLTQEQLTSRNITRVHIGPDGKPVVVDSGAKLDGSYAQLRDLQDTVAQVNQALQLAKNEADITELQLQLQRYQKVINLIEQNRGNAISFTFKLINFFAEIFGLQTIR
jgi:hypothetical protein